MENIPPRSETAHHTSCCRQCGSGKNHSGWHHCRQHSGQTNKTQAVRVRIFTLLAIILLTGTFANAQNTNNTDIDTMQTNTGENTGYAKVTCEKLPMTENGIVRLSKVTVYPQFIDEYIKFAVEVGEISLLTEPGVLTMYAVADKENPCMITILETYASQEAYKSHISSKHFQKYKQGTLHMVESLVLADQVPLNPANQLTNKISR